MAYIPNLSTASSFTASDYVIMAQGNNNNAQRVSAAVMAAFFASYLEVGSLVNYYSAPSATGFTTTVPDTDDNYWVILTPVAGYAAGTIVLPSSTTAQDQQTINVNCTQAVTTLTINGNGATVTGAPTTLAANAYFTLRFDAVTTTWYRVG
jgi:hypothetical protein